MKRKFSLELVDMFNYYCDVKKDYENCELILILLSFINESYDDYEYYLNKIKNHDKLMQIIKNRVFESLGGF